VAAEPGVEPLAENPGFAATQASPGLGFGGAPQSPLPVAPSQRQPPAAPAAAPAPVQSLEDLARSIAGDQPLPVMNVPALRGLTECLGMLLEAPPPLEPCKEKETPLEKLIHPLACKLLDDEGRERGTIIMDLRAALLLGAGLLALPRDEALRQLKDNEPSEDALLASSEICNNLTAPVNAVPGNPHVRSTVLASVDVSTLPKARARLDLAVDGGVIIFAMF
jgi:hypothetical protein